MFQSKLGQQIMLVVTHLTARLGRIFMPARASRFRRFVPLAVLAATLFVTVGIPATATAAVGQPAVSATTASKLAALAQEPAAVNVGKGVTLTITTHGPNVSAKGSTSLIHRSGNYFVQSCSANVSLTTHVQTCLLLWLGGSYGNYVRGIEGKFALYHSGRHTYRWDIEWMNSPKTWLVYSGSGNFGQPWWYLQTPQRYTVGAVAAHRYVMLGYRVWFILYQLENNKWVNVRDAYITVY